MAVPVSVIIPTWQRLEDLRKALRKLGGCDPAPSECLVHVDAGDEQTVSWLRENAAHVEVIVSSQQVGPGGGRNKLMRQATSPFVASFDDDSYPVDGDYFSRLVQGFEQHPQAGVIAAVISHRGEEIPSRRSDAHRVRSFVGCGCAYRRAAWEDTTGYVPLPLAYGMEEVDLAHQLLDQGWAIIQDQRLRVFHDTDLSHHQGPEMTAAAIANRALLAFLRYPLRYIGLGAAQYVNRIVWSVQHGRRRGILAGILKTPRLLWQHRNQRRPVSADTVQKRRRLPPPK